MQSRWQLSPFVGRALGGAHLTSRDHATLGQPVWGPAALTTDLELRLGLGPLAVDPVARLVALRARADALTHESPFYARSLGHDPWGTVRVLDGLLGALIEAGFDLDDPTLARLPRLAALARLATELPPGDADRLTRIERALPTRAPYRALTLAEPVVRWPGRWRRIFGKLGVAVHHSPTPIAPLSQSDLGQLQRALQGLPHSPLRGDGSVVLLRAETPDSLADAVAALVRTQDPTTLALLRTSEIAPLEAALAAHHLPRLGGARVAGVPLAGAWLPLVLGLARAPFDPEAAIDLLLLPDTGLLREHADRLARSMGDAPGRGSRNWLRDVERATAAQPDVMKRFAAWLDPQATLDAAALAERAALVDETLARRLRAHTRARHTADELAHPAAADAMALTREALGAILRALPRDGAIAAGPLDGLLRTFGEVSAQSVSRLEAGTLARIDDPAALHVDVDTLIWWGFVDPGPLPPSPFRADERALLGLDDPLVALAERRRSWRDAVMRTRGRLVLAAPERIGGQRQATHPLWSEIRGAIGWRDERDERVVTFDAKSLTTRPIPGCAPDTSARHPIAAVPASAAWTTQPIPSLAPRSVSALDTLLSCPLRYLLQETAGLRERAHGLMAEGPMLYGKLGHRLVERLFKADLLGPPAPAAAIIEAEARALIGDEAAHLLLPGRAAERRAVLRTLSRMLGALTQFITREGATVEDVERKTTVTLGERVVEGRMDLLLRARDGSPWVIDLKWSAKKPGASLDKGRAIQLAAYVRAHDHAGSSGAYFGLSDGRICGAAAPAFAAIWERAARTTAALAQAFARGTIPVVGVRNAPTLGALLGLDGGHDPDPWTACDYCRMGLVCGREPVSA